MKILFCNNNLAGMILFRKEVMCHFLERGCDVVVVTPDKTSVLCAKCVRVQKERDIDVIVDYKRKLAAIPIKGQWEAIKPVSGDMAEYVNAVEVEPDNTYLLTQKGNIIELGSGNLLSYDKAKDRLTIKYLGIEEGESTFTYKRQPRE